MAEYEIAWTFGGYTTVEAQSADEAREKFDALDHEQICKEAVEADPDLQVVDVQQSG